MAIFTLSALTACISQASASDHPETSESYQRSLLDVDIWYHLPSHLPLPPGQLTARHQVPRTRHSDAEGCFSSLTLTFRLTFESMECALLRLSTSGGSWPR